MTNDEGNIVENLHAVDGLCDSLNGQNLISDFAVRTEINVRILPAGRTDFIELDFSRARFLEVACLIWKRLRRNGR